MPHSKINFKSPEYLERQLDYETLKSEIKSEILADFVKSQTPIDNTLKDIRYSTLRINRDLHQRLVDYCDSKGLKIIDTVEKAVEHHLMPSSFSEIFHFLCSSLGTGWSRDKATIIDHNLLISYLYRLCACTTSDEAQQVKNEMLIRNLKLSDNIYSLYSKDVYDLLAKYTTADGPMNVTVTMSNLKDYCRSIGMVVPGDRMIKGDPKTLWPDEEKS